MKNNNLFNLSKLFFKYAQFTDLDTKVHKTKNENDAPVSRFYGRREGPEQKTFYDLLKNKYFDEKNVARWNRNDFNLPEEIKSFEVEKQKPEIKIISPDEFLLPEIEKYHLNEEQQVEVFEIYNKFKNLMKEFHLLYTQANQILSNKTVEDISKLDIIEAIRNIPEIVSKEIFFAQQRLLGEKSILLPSLLANKFNLNIFGPTYQNIRKNYPESIKIFLENICSELEYQIDNYKKIGKARSKIYKELEINTQKFLSDQKNIDFLNYASQYESSREIIRGIIADFVKPIHSYDSNISTPIYYDIKNLKTVKSLYEKYFFKIKEIPLTLERNINNSNLEIFNNISNNIYDKYNEILKEFENECDELSSFQISFSQLELAVSSLEQNEEASPVALEKFNKIEEIYNYIKNFLSNHVNIDLNSIEKIINNKNSILLFKLKFLENFTMTHSRWHSSTTESLFRDAKTKLYQYAVDLIYKQQKYKFMDQAAIFHDQELYQKCEEVYYKCFRDCIISKMPLYAVDISNSAGLIQEQGSVNLKSVFSGIKKILEPVSVDDKTILTFSKYCINNKLFDIFSLEKDHVDTLKVYTYILQKSNKLDYNNLIKYLKIDASFDNIKDLIRGIKVYNRTGHSSILSNEDLLEAIQDSIRNIDTIETDLKNFKEVIIVAHNIGNNLTKEQIITMCKNSNFNLINKLDIIKKLFMTYVSIISAGGLNKIKKQYGESIKDLRARKIISIGLFKKIENIVNFFESGEIINPKTSNFSELAENLSVVDTELSLIKTADVYKELFDKSEDKKPEIFLLNYTINPRLRFRVLKDKDPRILKIGIESDNCCQRVGDNAAGETAARDSFINSLAGVVILEWLENNSQWVLLAQSYFHYVPQDNSYILDNVEINTKNVRNSKVNLEEVYAYYANNISTKLNMKYFLAGAGYSKIDKGKFKTAKLRRDPRYFNPNSLTKSKTSHYTDFQASRSIDLTSPKFKIKSDPSTWGVIDTESSEQESE